VEIVRTQPRDAGRVITLPVPVHTNRLITPLDVPAGTVLREVVFADNVAYDPEGDAPGPLARALMAAGSAGAR
jgi:hypothetical protein